MNLTIKELRVSNSHKGKGIYRILNSENNINIYSFNRDGNIIYELFIEEKIKDNLNDYNNRNESFDEKIEIMLEDNNIYLVKDKKNLIHFVNNYVHGLEDIQIFKMNYPSYQNWTIPEKENLIIILENNFNKYFKIEQDIYNIDRCNIYRNELNLGFLLRINEKEYIYSGALFLHEIKENDISKLTNMIMEKCCNSKYH